jgi:hypothetical protein
LALHCQIIHFYEYSTDPRMAKQQTDNLHLQSWVHGSFELKKAASEPSM